MIDEARLKLHPTASVRTAVEALFRLEHGRAPEDLRRVIQSLDALLRDPAQQGLRRTFTVWIKRLLRRKVGSTSMTEIDTITDLLEADTMLAERIEAWFEEATRQGLQQGRLEGRLEGQSRLLARQIERRFGPLPAAVGERLAHAGEAELEAWGEAVLSAPTLAAVFDDTRH